MRAYNVYLYELQSQIAGQGYKGDRVKGRQTEGGGCGWIGLRADTLGHKLSVWRPPKMGPDLISIKYVRERNAAPRFEQSSFILFMNMSDAAWNWPTISLQSLQYKFRLFRCYRNRNQKSFIKLVSKCNLFVLLMNEKK